MFKSLLQFFGILALTFCSIQTLSAQDSEIGFWLGGTMYMGDLNPDYNPRHTLPAGGLVYRYNANPYMALKGTFSFAMLKHADSLSNNSYQKSRNLSFKTNVLEIGGHIDLHFKKFIIGSKKDFFTPYLTTGITGFYFSPKATLDGETYDLAEIGTEGQINADYTGNQPYKKVQIAIPLGFGIKYWMRKSWNMYVELSYRQTFTDYLDDVHDVYIDPVLLGGASSVTGALADRSSEVTDTGAIGIPGKQRGDKVVKDGYMLISIGFTHTIFNRKCEVPKN